MISTRSPAPAEVRRRSVCRKRGAQGDLGTLRRRTISNRWKARRRVQSRQRRATHRRRRMRAGEERADLRAVRHEDPSATPSDEGCRKVSPGGAFPVPGHVAMPSVDGSLDLAESSPTELVVDEGLEGTDVEGRTFLGFRGDRRNDGRNAASVFCWPEAATIMSPPARIGPRRFLMSWLRPPFLPIQRRTPVETVESGRCRPAAARV